MLRMYSEVLKEDITDNCDKIKQLTDKCVLEIAEGNSKDTAIYQLAIHNVYEALIKNIKTLENVYQSPKIQLSFRDKE